MSTRTGAVVLTVVVLIALAASAHAAPKSDVVYADSLTAGWTEKGYSWNANVNLAATPGAANSKRAVEAVLKPWGGVAFRAKRTVPVAKYTHVSFDACGKRGGETLRIALYLGRSELPKYGGLKLSTPLTTTFTSIDIALREFGPVTAVDKLAIMANDTGCTVFLDNIKFYEQAR